MPRIGGEDSQPLNHRTTFPRNITLARSKNTICINYHFFFFLPQTPIATPGASHHHHYAPHRIYNHSPASYMTKRIDYISTPHRSTIVTQHRVTRQTRIKRHLCHSLPPLLHGKRMKNGRERKREREKRSRGHRTSNNRAMLKAVRRVGRKTHRRLFSSEIAFSPKQLFRTFVACRITKKEERKKKKHSLSAINTRIHRENRAPPLPSTVFNSVFGISNGGGGGGAGRRSAANET